MLTENNSPEPTTDFSETSPGISSGTEDETSELQSFEPIKKKSILATKGTEYRSLHDHKRGSKATIQWDEDLEEKTLVEKLKTHRKSRLHALGLLMARGSKLSYIQEVLGGLKAEEALLVRKATGEGQQEFLAPKGFDSLVQDLWYGMLNRTPDGGAELSLDQQVNLESLKHKIKTDNEKYLKRHPELNILLSLVYRKLLKEKPEDPKLFVAKYVHHLNTHREELVLEDDIIVPFDCPAEPEQIVIEEDFTTEKQEIEIFARELVQKCASMAALGMAHLDVTNIIDSMLRTVSPSEDSILDKSIKSAEDEVSRILFSLLNSVALSRARSAEIIAEEIIDSVFDRICPEVQRDSESFERMTGSVEEFVQHLLDNLTEKAIKEVILKNRMAKYEQIISGTRFSARPNNKNTELDDRLSNISATTSILKKVQSDKSQATTLTNQDDQLESKVKFKSVSD